MVASIAAAPPGSTVVRRAETLSNYRDGRSGQGAQRDEPDGKDDLHTNDEGTDKGAARPQNGVAVSPTRGLTVEDLLVLQQQPEPDGTAEDDSSAYARSLTTRSSY